MQKSVFFLIYSILICLAIDCEKLPRNPYKNNENDAIENIENAYEESLS